MLVHLSPVGRGRFGGRELARLSLNGRSPALPKGESPPLWAINSSCSIAAARCDLPDQDRRASLRRREKSFSQGAKWKALISKYIGTIPLSGDAPATEHNTSGAPPRNTRQQRHDREGRRGREV